MQKTAHRVGALVVCGLISLIGWAGQTELITQDAAVIEGTAVDARTGQPVAGVSVSLELSRRGRADLQRRFTADPTAPRIADGPFAGFPDTSLVDGEHRTTTNDAGLYQFVDVRPGEYHLYATADGFLVTYIGIREVPALEPVIEVGAGSHLEFDFRLPAGAVISGHVLDPSGAPVVGATVVAQSYQYVGGRRLLRDFVSVGLPDLSALEEPPISSQG